MMTRMPVTRYQRAARYSACCLILFLGVFANRAHAVACTSTVGGGTWNVGGTWVAGCGAGGPVAGDTVTIVTGATVTIASAANAATITVNNGGTLTIGNDATARAVTVTGNIGVAGTFSVGATATTHTLTVAGDISNTGTINFAPTATRLCNVTFNRNGNQVVSGAGATAVFNGVTLNMGATSANILDITATNFSLSGTGFVTITNGTFKLSSNIPTLAPFENAAKLASPNFYLIPATGGFWLNSTTTVNIATVATSYNVSVDGTLRISNGTVNLGRASDDRLRIRNTAGNSALILMEGGALNITGRLSSVTATDNGTFQQTGGTITVGTIGNTLGTFGPFFLGNATNFQMSAGQIIIQEPSNPVNTANAIDIRSPAFTVTGGTVQIGNALTPAAGPVPSFYISTVAPFWNCIVNGTNNPTAFLILPLTVLNDMTINTGGTLNPNNPVSATAQNITMGGGTASGAWNNSGTVTASTNTVTFTGSGAAAAIGGTTATTFNNLTINKASNNLTINTTPTINATLTLTSGDIVTGANRVIVGTAGTIATPSAASYVQGTFQKNYLAAANLSYFAGNNFPVGDATNFTPVNVSAGVTSTAGSLTVSTTATDHPQVTTPIASTGIDAASSVNRYWTMNNAGLTLTTNITATYTFVAADLDVAAATGSFIVERYDTTNWNPTTIGALGGTSTQASNITLSAGNNDFAIGNPLTGVTPVPGRYNAFETTTPAGSILGKIQTRVANVPFGIDIVNINATKTGVQATSITVEIRLVDSSGGGALDVNGCNVAWPVIPVLPGVSNPPNFVIPASGRGTPPAITVANSYRDVRILIRSPVGGPYTQIGCSTDRFAIRPASITVSATDATWATAGTARTLNAVTSAASPVHKAGTSASPMPFTIKAVAQPVSVTNYDGTPTIKAGSPVCNTTLSPGCTTGVLSLGAFTAAAGTVTSTTANYGEVGAITLDLEDQLYANVDAVDGSTTAQRYITQTTAALAVGRFVPDHFLVATNNTPQYKTFNTTDASCAGSVPLRSFTYVGQPFGWVTAPQALVTAQNAANGTTVNYSGALWKLIATDVTETYPAAPFDASSKGAPTVAQIPGTGTGTVTSNAGGTFLYTRGAALAPYNANISLTESVQDANENIANQGTISTGTSAVFNGGGTGIAFDGGGASSGKEFRYGQIRISNMNGSELLPMVVPIEAQYWNGTGFTTNTADNCTSLLPASFVQTPGPGAVVTTTITGAGSLTAGVGTITLTKPSPTPASKGSVVLTPSAAISAYLPVAPSGGRETFGVFKSGRIIHLREVY